MTQSADIRRELQKRILVLDGAMGTMIQEHRLTEKDFRGERFASHSCDVRGNNDMLCLTQPALIESIHMKYLHSGADIITTNTFNANRISLSDYDMESLVHEINACSARLARKAVDECNCRTPDRPRFVAGTLGPTNKTLSMSPDVNDPAYRAITFEYMTETYIEQIEGLIDG
jgi:5-methyltetrahydrofolate--homocysteine methyltransferase